MTWLKKHDVLTKAIAFLVAFVLWLVIVNVDDIDETHTFKGVEPVFVGQEELGASKNLLIVGKYSVDIEVSGKRGDLLALNNSNIKVEVDVSKISGVGTYSLPYTVTLPSDMYSIRNKKPETLSVKIDKEDINVVPVKLSTDGIAADGYTVDEKNINISPIELKITGLREEVDKIAYAEVDIQNKNIKTSLIEKLGYVFYDAEGNALKNLTSVQADYKAVDVSLPVLKIKDVQLALDVEEGEDFAKYVKYTFEPKTIRIAGEESVVDQMTKLVVGKISISEASSETEKTFEIALPDGIINLDDKTQAKAKLKIDGLSVKTVKTTLIQLVNINTLPDGYRIKPVTDSLDVSIVGREADVKNIDSSNVRAMVDLGSTVLSKGIHPIKASIVLDIGNDVNIINSDEYIVYVEVW